MQNDSYWHRLAADFNEWRIEQREVTYELLSRGPAGLFEVVHGAFSRILQSCINVLCFGALTFIAGVYAGFPLNECLDAGCAMMIVILFVSVCVAAILAKGKDAAYYVAITALLYMIGTSGRGMAFGFITCGGVFLLVLYVLRPMRRRGARR